MALQHEVIPLSGERGTITGIIEGRTVELAEFKNITAGVLLNKASYKVMGDGATRYKYAGWEGTGSATYHWVSSRWAKIIISVIKTGVMPYMSLIIKNLDPQSEKLLGSQTITLLQVSIDGGDIAKLDIGTTMLEGAFNFTYSGVEVADSDFFNDVI